ncbi:MAG TPA: glutaredoxin 3 [Steroidobacteraceae bacterium]|nr:glutaredoxin 3 [Steroidobacteraceae bacterium]
MAGPKVVMYASGWCPYCSRARQLLTTKSAAFEEIDVDARPGARAEMIERSGGRRTVPQIFIGERHIGGCDDLLALEATGELEQLLRGESQSG